MNQNNDNILKALEIKSMFEALNTNGMNKKRLEQVTKSTMEIKTTYTHMKDIMELFNSLKK